MNKTIKEVITTATYGTLILIIFLLSKADSQEHDKYNKMVDSCNTIYKQQDTLRKLFYEEGWLKGRLYQDSELSAKYVFVKKSHVHRKQHQWGLPIHYAIGAHIIDSIVGCDSSLHHFQYYPIYKPQKPYWTKPKWVDSLDSVIPTRPLITPCNCIINVDVSDTEKVLEIEDSLLEK